MISDNDRREVARRLRGLEQGVIGTLIPTGELAENILRAIDYGYSDAMTPYGRLADLIEPSCDRDALLALADKMSRYASLRKSHGMDVDTMAVMAWVHRIREALGASDD